VEERPQVEAQIQRAAGLIRVDWEALMGVARRAAPVAASPVCLPPSLAGRRIALARAAAFTFTYEANGYTYLVTLLETESAYWTVQAYCPTTDFEAAKDQMWEILTSIKIS
jgi:cobyrinic acid a,c-diamide synthase